LPYIFVSIRKYFYFSQNGRKLHALNNGYL